MSEVCQSSRFIVLFCTIDLPSPVPVDLIVNITGNCRQIWRPDQPMSLFVSSIVGGVIEQNSIVNKCLRR